MIEYPTDRHGLVFRRSAVDAGFSDNQLARAHRSGDLIRIWPGASVSATEELSPQQRYRLQSIAAAELGDGANTLSHQSSGMMLGLSMLEPAMDRVHFSTGLASGGRVEKRRHLHAGFLDESEIVVVDGIAVTSMERTAADIACAGTFAQALAVLDSALRLGADPEVIAEKLVGTRTGVARARRALGHADPLSENAGESWGRAQMIEAGLPVPRLQHEFVDGTGVFVARSDYDWDGRLVGEFDGWAKYQRHLSPGETSFDAMRREKNREDALRRMGIMVVRWTWDALRRGLVVPMIAEWLGRLGIAA
ncbi:hypothetical protein [Gordonia soli]|uniref:AbiEi antitoxin C-terminal domain-containing protein n=1 Tax=Gordonia soli NBRC 108243 TaxID=1223545 RepID=M0QFE2_9ACTN|nr:hypothetical protein [Gordonia soli]GAC67021.1 hypothetical protein GS4_05_02340 [Gordonia soli NBRC 108243]